MSELFENKLAGLKQLSKQVFNKFIIFFYFDYVPSFIFI